MDTKDLFQIGEVAKMFHLSVSSLRHYEEIGLLLPEAVDPESGYRYYSTRQFEALNTIRYLRALDMPLAQIADFLQDRDVGRIEEKLRKQKEIVVERQRELRRIERKIDNRLRQLKSAQDAVPDRIELARLSPCRLVRMESSLTVRGFLDMEAPLRKLDQEQREAVIFLGKVGVGISAEHLYAGSFGQYDGIFLILDEEDEYDGQAEKLPETLCVRVCFKGSHTEAPAQYRRLMAYVEAHRLEVTGFSREITMIDYGITNDTEKFVTQICIPVRER